MSTPKIHEPAPSWPTRVAPNPIATVGDYQTEADTRRAFDASVSALEAFKIHQEVSGRTLTSRPFEDFKTFRIDRILEPKPALVEAGWTFGPVGVELKHSGKKLGKPLGQLLDYSRCAWNLNGQWIVPEWYFLFPMSKQHGAMQSLLASQRCGGAYLDHEHRLVLHSAFILAKLSPDRFDVRPENANHGHKVGSR